MKTIYTVYGHNPDNLIIRYQPMPYDPASSPVVFEYVKDKWIDASKYKQLGKPFTNVDDAFRHAFGGDDE